MTAPYESLRRLFAEAGYVFVEPPIVHPASVFVELAGEDLRRRLYLTTAADGTELALRPDYTIPVCLHHLSTGAAKRKAGYAYLGRVFRHRRDEPGEFLQAGIESLGRMDRAAADADALKLALDALALLGVDKIAVRIGDSGVFGAVLDALDLSPPWKRRLARHFGNRERVAGLIARANGGAKTAVAATGPGQRTAARRRAAEALEATGLATIDGRTADEIADRFVDKAVIAAGIGDRPAKVLSRYLAIAGTPARALGAMRALARSEKLAIDKALDRFEARTQALGRRGVDLPRLTFAADFGRRLDYYTGFVFEVHDAARPGSGQIVGGGRYDRMMALISAGAAVPAVGFSIWLDRIGGGR
jgi:ATP phosphoribosyltransferase regulatory subunit